MDMIYTFSHVSTYFRFVYNDDVVILVFFFIIFTLLYFTVSLFIVYSDKLY